MPKMTHGGYRQPGDGVISDRHYYVYNEADYCSTVTTGLLPRLLCVLRVLQLFRLQLFGHRSATHHSSKDWRNFLQHNTKTRINESFAASLPPSSSSPSSIASTSECI